MKKDSENLRLFLALGLVLFAYTVIFVHPVFAGDFFSNFSNTLSDFLFKKVGKILFLVFLVAGIIAFPKSLSLAILLISVAVLLAVGSGLASAVWSFFNGSSSSSSNSGQIMYAYNYISMVVAG